MLFARCRRSLGLAALAGGLCLTIGGCSTFVPHVKPDPLPANDPFRLTCAAATASTLTPDQHRQNIGASVMRAMRAAGGVDPQLVGLNLCEGYIRAEEYRRDYYKAVRTNSGLKTTLTALLVPLTGLAVREGFDPNPSNAKIADFSVGAVVLYGWATALTSAPRQKVYLNGMQAMSCAMIESQPIMVGVMQLQPLEVQVGKVKDARAKFEQALDEQRLKPLVNAGDEKYLKLQSDADNAIARVAEYSQQLAQAAGQLLPMVETIAAQVGRNIVDTEPSIESLLTLINGMGAQSRGFVTAALPPTSPATPKAQSGDVDRLNAEARVLTHYKTLRAEVEALNTMLSKVITVAQATTKIAACKADGVTNEFKVEPADAVSVIKVGEVREFKVTNKISMPTASLEGEGSDSVERLDTIVRDQTFILRIKGLKATGEAGPTLVIKDGTGQQEKRIALRVAAAETASGTKPEPADGAGKPAAITDDEKTRVVSAALVSEVDGEKPADFLRRSISALQCVVKANVDGAVGANTRTKIAEFMADTAGRPDPGVIDDALITRVSAALGADAKDCADQQ
jgi:hypothetical protein